jgi:transposase
MSYPPRKAIFTGMGRMGTVGAQLRYLPPYFPVFNLIEIAFPKLKALVKKAAARTIKVLWNAIADALSQLKAEECINFCAAAGYGAI